MRPKAYRDALVAEGFRFAHAEPRPARLRTEVSAFRRWFPSVCCTAQLIFCASRREGTASINVVPRYPEIIGLAIIA
jgi:UDP-N-acetylglucosamine enolpyruvyl transferase